MAYVNYSMSERAVAAYESGEMPLSKWGKYDILEGIENTIEDKSLLPYFEKLTLKTLRSLFLHLSSWHHTGKFYKTTDFYSLDEDFVLDTTLEDLKYYIDKEKEEARQRKINRVKAPKVKAPNLYITAYVSYTVWTGTRNHPKCETRYDIVHYRSEDKMVNTYSGRKRLSSLDIHKKVEQKTKYASDKKVLKGKN